MANTIPAGLQTGLLRTDAGFLLPPKFIDKDRLDFERAKYEPKYSSLYFQPPGWIISVLRELRIYVRSWMKRVMAFVNRACGRGIEALVPDMVTDLRYLRYSGNFFAADEKIRTTPHTLLSHASVAAEAANLYLELGHIRAARAVIDGSVLPHAIQQEGWLYREEIVVLAIISLLVDVQRTMDFAEAQFVFENVEDIFLRLDCT
jgi:hypothetical protein